MSSREDILQSIRRNTRVRYEKLDYLPLEQEAMTYLDKLARFQEVMTQVGGRAVILQEGEDLNTVIRKLSRWQKGQHRSSHSSIRMILHLQIRPA